MNKIVKYIIIFLMMIVISVLAYANQIGNYMNNLLFNIIYIIGGYAISFFIVNYIFSISFCLIGNFKGFKVSSVNLYPFYILNNKIRISFNLINFY